MELKVATAGKAPGLPAEVTDSLDFLLGAAVNCFGGRLVSVLLFGSAAEGRLRANSDVNLLLVLTAFDRADVDPLREELRVARAAARVSPMFVLESELDAAAELFAVKFDDIARRSVVLFGADVRDRLDSPREARIARLRQILLNLTVRLRERYAMVSLREEQLAGVIADAAPPLRAAAAAMLELRGETPGSPRDALIAVARGLDAQAFEPLLQLVSEARETLRLPPGAAPEAVMGLIRLATLMRGKAQDLR